MFPFFHCYLVKAKRKNTATAVKNFSPPLKQKKKNQNVFLSSQNNQQIAIVFFSTTNHY